MGATLGLILGSLIYRLHFRPLILRAESEATLKAIGIALNQFADDNGHFPANASVLEATKSADLGLEGVQSAHSWRTRLLPYLNGDSTLPKQVDWESAWTARANAKARAQSVMYFRSPYDIGSKSNHTSYLGVVGEEGRLPETFLTPRSPESPRHSFDGYRRADITDGSANTIAVIEVIDSGIEWMEPRDLTLNEAIQLIRSSPDGVNVVMVYGDVWHLDNTVPEDNLRALMTINGGESVTPADCGAKPVQ